MEEKKMFCVISHTHWDREWYMPLELMRLRLVDLMDRCLELLAREPSYVFHLDAQTIVLEDYLSIRYDRRSELEHYIREGRLSVGPWYLQNDYYLTSGEATVRNLLEGRKIADSFGKCGTVGYSPDQFGNISQLPQILRGFGIDNFVFGRGAARYESLPDGTRKRTSFPSEFIWEGPDGSRLLAIHMSFWYNNAQRFSADLEWAEKMAKSVESTFEGIAATPYLLCMNGVDHLEAQDDLLPILGALRERGYDIRQMRMDEYIQLVRSYLDEKKLPVYTHHGELRGGRDNELLKGTLSSRAYLKQWNVLLQNRLERQLEPLYAMLALRGTDALYPAQHLRYLWKELMKNHPHDSICGCSRDEVHHHMEDNFERLDEMSSEMLRRGMELAAAHIALVNDDPKNYGIAVANTLSFRRSGMVHVTVDLPCDEGHAGFDLLDSRGNPVPFRVLSAKQAVRDIFSPINLPGWMPVDRYEIVFLAKDIPGFGFSAYTIKGNDTALRSAAPAVCAVDTAVLENDCLRVEVQADGRVNLLDKQTGRVMPDCLDFEDTADRGDSYIYDGGGHPAIFGHSAPAQITMLDDHKLCQSVLIKRTMQLPAEYDFAGRCRSKQMVDCPVWLTLTLHAGEPVLQVNYRVENHAKDHRLRLLVRTGIHAAVSAADIPFDIVRHGDEAHDPDTGSRVLPNTSFAAMETAKGGVSVLTTGQHEYEQMDDTLAFTVLRATGVINRNPETLEIIGGEQWTCPANQCLRTMEGRVGVYPFERALEDCVPQMAAQFDTPLLTTYFSADPKKFAGGRTAVQDTTIAEFFYLKDACPSMHLRSGEPVLSLAGDAAVEVTAFKRADCRGGYILRLFNPDDKPHTVEIPADGHWQMTTLSEETDTPINSRRIPVAPKAIVTLRFIPQSI